MDAIKILEEEHKHILKTIDMLERLLNKEKFTEKGIKELKFISHVFIEAENHHKREENVLFPAIEAKGIEGPTHVMRMEHDELRLRKRNLAKLAKEFKQSNMDKINENGGFIIDVLRPHIDKENNILYPMARSVLSQKELKEIKAKFDKIGYCCFSPK